MLLCWVNGTSLYVPLSLDGSKATHFDVGYKSVASFASSNRQCDVNCNILPPSMTALLEWAPYQQYFSHDVYLNLVKGKSRKGQNDLFKFKSQKKMVASVESGEIPSTVNTIIHCKKSTQMPQNITCTRGIWGSNQNDYIQSVLNERKRILI